MSRIVAGYSSIQIGLHWAVVVTVAVQFVASSGIEAAWNALREGAPAPHASDALTVVHIATGMAVLMLTMARIFLRMTRGAPPPPADKPWLMQVSAHVVHVAIYTLLFLLPATGLVAWFLDWPPAASVHAFLTNVLLAAIALHIAGALFQHFVRRSDVLMRMLRPEPGAPAAPDF